ncbi:MAG: PH domain-containing protein [Planctomycetaceae bacterium]|nr:PH domain-containing protein [Planctomycetaceae bacterium]
MTTQAIAGVSPESEAVVTTEYPSIAAGGLGQLLGQLYDSIPIRIFGPKVSYIFALLTAPVAILLYFATKIFGERYVLTNRQIQIWSARGGRKIASASLDDVGAVEIEQHPGQVFYRAADLRIKKPTGETLIRLRGVPDAGGLRNAILRTVESRRLVASSLSRIAARR